MREQSPRALSDGDEDLAREAQLFTRYLLDRDCPPEMADRYVRAHRVRITPTARETGRRVCEFALAHPVTLPYLDAAQAILDRGGALRTKLLIMSAVLEASPKFAMDFLPRHESLPRTLLSVAWFGFVGGARAIIGIPLAVAVGVMRR